MSSLAEHFSLEKELFCNSKLQNYHAISKTRQKPLIETVKLNKDYSIMHFHGADKKYSLVCRKHKIVIPKVLQKQVVERYHNALYHPEETRRDLSMAQYF